VEYSRSALPLAVAELHNHNVNLVRVPADKYACSISPLFAVPLPTYRQLPCGEADSAKRDIATPAYGEDKQLSACCSPRYVI
jgi:hypothetical protein